MPIYEFYCRSCHRIYNFLSRTIETKRAPDCPRCGEKDLGRMASSFAISKGRTEEVGRGQEELPNLDEGRLMKLMEELGPEAEHGDEENPRQAAQTMRRLLDATGVPIGDGMQEALRRMESGEDPEKVEQELGEALDQDPFGGSDARKALSTLRRRLQPPTVDTHLYEL
jgi:putative FmdB family regulatory protein